MIKDQRVRALMFIGVFVLIASMIFTILTEMNPTLRVGSPLNLFRSEATIQTLVAKHKREKADDAGTAYEQQFKRLKVTERPDLNTTIIGPSKNLLVTAIRFRQAHPDDQVYSYEEIIFEGKWHFRFVHGPAVCAAPR